MTTVLRATTLSANTADATVFTTTGTRFLVDVDTPGGCIQVQTQRSSGDSAWKPLRLGPAATDTMIVGPQTVEIGSVGGRRFRLVNLGDTSCAVGAEE